MKHVSSGEEENATPSPIRDAEDSTVSMYNEIEYARQQARQKAGAPIGVFDSGAGGLTILSALRRELSGEDYIFLGDTAHVPYGVRDEADIIELSVNSCRYLVNQGVKMIVVACNTASQAALSVLRSTFSIPFVGVVPAVKPAARVTRNGKIGVAATNQAVQAAYLHQLIDNFAEGIDVYTVGCPELVTLVERGELDGTTVEETLSQTLHPLLEQNIDVLVLGCTHFPALRPAIERVVGSKVQVIDSGSAIARRTHAVLDAEGLIRPGNTAENGATECGKIHVLCSGDAAAFSTVASKILGYSVIAHHITV